MMLPRENPGLQSVPWWIRLTALMISPGSLNGVVLDRNSSEDREATRETEDSSMIY